MGIVGLEIVTAIKHSENTVRFSTIFRAMLARSGAVHFRASLTFRGCTENHPARTHEGAVDAELSLGPSSMWRGRQCTYFIFMFPSVSSRTLHHLSKCSCAPHTGEGQEGCILPQSKTENMVSRARGLAYARCQHGCHDHATLHAHRVIYPRHPDGLSCA